MQTFKLLTSVTFFTAFFSLVGCHTVAGFGTDVQKGGQAINKAATTTPAKSSTVKTTKVTKASTKTGCGTRCENTSTNSVDND